MCPSETVNGLQTVLPFQVEAGYFSPTPTPSKAQGICHYSGMVLYIYN
jgi:hypothetical protein